MKQVLEANLRTCLAIMRTKVDELIGSFSIDLSAYYTKSQTNTAIATAISGISLANYYTKDETYTQTQVNTAIDTKIAAIGNFNWGKYTSETAATTASGQDTNKFCFYPES
jgi:hypothetical protein